MGALEFLHRIVDYLFTWIQPNSHWGYLTYNRKNGQIVREKEPLLKRIKLLVLFSPIMEWIDTTKAMRLYIHTESVNEGKQEGTPASKKQIRNFVEKYGIDMRDFDPSDIDEYKTFEDFFTREHRQGSRPVHEQDDNSSAVCVADSRVVAYESVAETKKLWIKGSDFSMAMLLMDTYLAREYAEAAVASFRLSPQDYHRYHAPVAGKIKAFRSIPGDYYQVDPVALQSDVDILTRNRREFLIIETEEFGDVLFVAIGATNVGSVYIHDRFHEAGTEVKKGEELGYFQFGGSSIIVAFTKGTITFDKDLLEYSKKQIQVAVEVGMSLGRAVRQQ